MKTFDLKISSADDYIVSSEIDNFLAKNSIDIFKEIYKECINLINDNQEIDCKPVVLNIYVLNSLTDLYKFTGAVAIGVTSYNSLMNYIDKQIILNRDIQEFESCHYLQKCKSEIQDLIKTKNYEFSNS